MSSLACIAALSLAACGGQSAGFVPSSGNGGAPPSGGHHKKVRADVVIRIPARRRTRNPHLRHMQFISASTNAIQVQTYKPNSAHTVGNLIASTITDLSSGSSACTVNGDGSRSCTFTMSVPPPADDFVFTTWNLAPVSGAIPGSAKQLAAASLVNQPIAVGHANTLDVTLGGIVTSLQLSLPNPTVVSALQTSNIHGVLASTQNFGVNALDAGGSVILSDGYVDATGASESVKVAVTASSGTCGSGTLQLGNATAGSDVSLSQPATAGVQFNYGATSFAAVFKPATACTFAIAATLGTASANAQFALLGPEFTETALVGGSNPEGIVLGKDGALWFTECGTSKIGRITATSTPVVTEFPTVSSNAQPTSITSGPDGALWFTESASVSNIGRIPTSATPGSSAQISEYATVSSSSNPAAIVSGTDGKLWYTENITNAIANITTDGATSNEYSIPNNPGDGWRPIGITSGPDGNLWFAESFGSAIGQSTTGGTIKQFTGLTSGAFPVGIISGPDGALWFTEASNSLSGANNIGRMTTAGVLTNEYPTTTTASYPVSIVTGPDGALWFAECSAGNVGRITTGGTMTEYAIPTAASFPNDIVVGPDGALWFTESLSSKIGRLSW